MVADVEHNVGHDAGEDGPELGTAQREGESEQGEQKEPAVRDATRAADQGVGMPPRPEQPIEERLVDQVGQQASEDEPARGKPLAQAEEEAGTDSDVAEDEQIGAVKSVIAAPPAAARD